jgi:hypothetical protein
VTTDDLNDWCYFDPKGELNGCFTVAAVQQAARRPRERDAES